MAYSPLTWIRENAAVYFGNAATTRDYRSQLRGNKPVFLWTAYLALLIVVMTISYTDIVRQNQGSVASIQRQLGTFYQAVTAMLGGLIALVTPSLTATTVISERQRKSLDLVFSSPVSLKYYLVGKMLSSLRYTWMLLALALPIVAVCVVMGGATWVDVVGAYILLTGASLVFTAVGLLMSVTAPTMVSAVLGTYLVILVYNLLLGSLASVVAVGSTFWGRSSMEQSWVGGLSPFTAAMAAPTYTKIYGMQVPNWVLVSLYSVLMCKILVLGAASALSPYGGSETKSLRIHVISYLAILGAILAASIPSVIGGGITSSDLIGVTSAWVAVATAFWMPTIACFAVDGDRRNRPDGWFNVRRLLAATPSGGLPFSLLLPLAYFGGLTAVFELGVGGPLKHSVAAYLFWTGAYTCFWWGIARFVSSFGKALRVARFWVGCSFIAILLLPLPFLSGIAASAGPPSPSEPSVWVVYILYPITQGKPDVGNLIGYGFGMLAAGIGLAVAADWNVREGSRRRMG